MITITITPKTPAQMTAALRLLEQFNNDSTLVERASLTVEQAKDLADAQANREDDAAREALQAKRDAAKKPKAAKAAATSTPEAAAVTSESAAASDTAAEEKHVVVREEPPVTLEEVRAKLAALSQAGKKAEAKALLDQFGVAKLTDLPSDKYAEVLAAAEEI